MKTKTSFIAVSIFYLLFLFVYTTGCNHKDQNSPDDIESQPDITEQGIYKLPTTWAQKVVDDIRRIQPEEIPDHLTEDSNTGKTGDEFDMNEYFTILTHISMESEYLLDYVYPYDMGFGGRPLIYVRKSYEKPYTTYEQYEKTQEQNSVTENLYDFVGFVMSGEQKPYDNKIKVDGTPEGYFEYIVLQILGGQFYLSWHANYDDATIICTKSALEGTVKDSLSSLGIGLENYGPTAELLAKGEFIEFTPTVDVQEEVVIVNVIIFTKWGGFEELSFIIDKNYPHKINDVKVRTILDYECGVTF